MSDLYALHAVRGHFKTPARATAWLLKMGLSEKLVASFPADLQDQQEWLARYLPHHPRGFLGLENVPTTATELVRTTFATVFDGVHVLKRARIIYHEIDEPYPIEVEQQFIELSQEFNTIKEADILNRLQKEIVAATETGPAALALIKTVESALALIRKKDAMGAHIAILSLFYDAALAHQEQKHRSATTVSEATERLLLKLLRLYQRQELTVDCLLTDFSEAEYEELCAFVHASPEIAGVDLHELLQQYLQEAEHSLFVTV